MKYIILGFLLISSVATNAQTLKPSELAHTFSIVARDAKTGEMGVGVQSHWFSVGTSVSWAEAGVGAVATQSFTNKSFGIRGLALLKEGKTSQEALDILLSDDEGREVRQVAIVDSKGNVAAHTGNKCIQYASHFVGDQFSVQSNMMLTDQVTSAMSAAYKANLDKPLAERIMATLNAAQAAGGDIRGKQSAALLIVPAKSKGEPWNEREIDLRVDDSDNPLKELARLLNVQEAYQHMNLGDLAVEVNNMQKAMEEYGAAMKMQPDNLEMQYWTAITLANSNRLDEALPMLKKIFAKDKNWKELTSRLPASGLLTVDKAGLEKIMSL